MMTTDLRVTRARFAVLYWLLALNAVGVSILLSLLPSVARAASIPDMLVMFAQALSAIAWIFVAGYWTRITVTRGHRRVVLIGAAGACLATLLTASAIYIGVRKLVPPLVALAALIVGRSAYGGIGLATAPAAQAFVAQGTAVERRAAALSGLASAQSTGMIIGPAIAPILLVDSSLGLSAPLFIVALAMLLSIPLCRLLPATSPSIDSEPKPAAPAISLWQLPDIRRYLLYAGFSAVAMFATMQTIGFAIIDELRLPPNEAMRWVGQVLMIGAVATLLTQTVIVPLAKISPRRLMLLGPLLSIAACATFALLPSYPVMLAASLILNTGFALSRPGVAAAASLALPIERQAEVAGAQLSVTSLGIVVGPIVGVGLYSVWQPLPFLTAAALLCAALAMSWRIPVRSDDGAAAGDAPADAIPL